MKDLDGTLGKISSDRDRSVRAWAGTRSQVCNRRRWEAGLGRGSSVTGVFDGVPGRVSSTELRVRV